MNASLTAKLTHVEIAQPKRLNWIALIASLFAFLFRTADDPAAFRYAAGKYNGELD